MINQITKEEFAKKYERIYRDFQKLEKLITSLIEHLKQSEDTNISQFILTHKNTLCEIQDSVLGKISILEDNMFIIKAHSLSFCSNCNKDLELTFKFCPECGGKSKLEIEK